MSDPSFTNLICDRKEKNCVVALAMQKRKIVIHRFTFASNSMYSMSCS